MAGYDVSLLSLEPERIVIGHGPCTPNETGVSLPLISARAGRFPPRAVRLGYQAIGKASVGCVVKAPWIMNGKTSRIFHDGLTLFEGVPGPFEATCYRSLAVAPERLLGEFEVSAGTEEGEIKGHGHRAHTIEGMQFHPESILLTCGERLLQDFLALRGGRT